MILKLCPKTGLWMAIWWILSAVLDQCSGRGPAMKCHGKLQQGENRTLQCPLSLCVCRSLIPFQLHQLVLLESFYLSLELSSTTTLRMATNTPYKLLL